MARLLFFLTILLLCSCVSMPRNNTATRVQKIRVREAVTLGGVKQHILVRGEDARNPLLLFVHGGPGIPEMPISQVNRDLEREFTVVQWDQRGAGLSFDEALTPAQMRVDFFVEDAEELARYLLNKFGKRKLFLAGYSWGSFIGALTVSRAPELFHAYAGISQYVNLPDSEVLLYRDALARASDQEDAEAMEILRRIGPPPHGSQEDADTMDAVSKKLAIGAVPHALTPAHYTALALPSLRYPFRAKLDIARGVRFSRVLNTEFYRRDLLKEAPQLDVPVYFLAARHDTLLSPDLMRRYYEKLDAPRGKKFILFNNSFHSPHIEEREKYRALMRRIKAEVLGRHRWD